MSTKSNYTVVSYASLEADGPTITAASATLMVNPQAYLPVPPGSINNLGQHLTIRGSGRFSSTGSSVTGTLDLRVGGTGGTVIWNGGAIPINTTTHTTMPFKFMIDIALRANGSSATWEGQGIIWSRGMSNTAGNADSTQFDGTVVIPSTNPAAGNAADFSPATAQYIAPCWTWSTTSQSITLTEYFATLEC